MELAGLALAPLGAVVSAVEQRPNSAKLRSFICPSIRAEIYYHRNSSYGLELNTAATACI